MQIKKFLNQDLILVEDRGVKVNSVELDLWAPTPEFLEGRITKEERDSRKQKKVTRKEAEEASNRLVEASQDGSIAIGDCPGKMSQELKIISQECNPCDHTL